MPYDLYNGSTNNHLVRNIHWPKEKPERMWRSMKPGNTYFWWTKQWAETANHAFWEDFIN